MLKKYTLRIDGSTLDKLNYIADNNFRTTNKELELVILEHIEKFEKTNGVIKIKR